MRFLIIGLLLSSAVMASDLQPYTATYAFNLDNRLSGKATRALTRQGDIYRYQFGASAMVASASEISDFRYNGRVQSLHYENTKQVFFRSRKVSVDYDWAAKKAHAVRNQQPLEYALQTDALDPLNMEIQIRDDLLKYNKLRDDYMLADAKGLFPLKFEINGRETITTPYGRLDTVKVRRVDVGSQRETQFWLAKSLDYLPVKFVQKDEGAVYTLELAAYTGGVRPLAAPPAPSAPLPAAAPPTGTAAAVH